MIAFSSDQWAILALVFVLGLLVGAFLFAGSGRKWKQRYRSETERREAIEREHADDRSQWESREKEWREQDSLRGAAIRDRRDVDVDRRDVDVDRRDVDVNRRDVDMDRRDADLDRRDADLERKR